MAFLPSVITSLVRSVFSSEDPDSPGVHEYTHEPTKAWEMLSVKQTVEPAHLPHLKAPINPKKVRFVCVSDTHNRLPLKVEVPDGDVLIHSGDFSMIGKPDEVQSFNTWLGTMPHKHKLVIAGNHELTFDPDMMSGKIDTSRFGLNISAVKAFLSEHGLKHMKELLTNCTYLEDSGATVCGVSVYGSPWQPEFCDWGFNLPRGHACLEKWNMIPAGVDVLMTHGPPIGHGDLCSSEIRAGCVELLETIQTRVKCKYHVFGHIHEAYGATTDGNTTYINACTCTRNYRPCNNPIIFDIPLPPGATKEDFHLGIQPSDASVNKTEAQSGAEHQGTDKAEEEEEMEVAEEKVEEKEEEKGPLVLNQNYQLEPTLAPHSSTSIEGSFKM